MKRWTTLLLLPLLAACSKAPEVATDPAAQTIEVAIGSGPRLDITTQSATRTTLDEEGTQVKWQTGDQLALWAVNSASQRVIEAATFSLYHYNASYNSASFRGSIPALAEDTYSYYAVSPVPAATDGLQVSYDIPAVQDGTFHGEWDVMVAKPVTGEALREHDRIPRESTLSREEVNNLANDLGVDFLVALEDVRLRSLRKVSFLPDINAYHESTDVKVFPTFSIYLPNRQGPVTTILSTDSIFWDEVGASEGEVQANSIKEDDLIEAASQFAGTTPIRYLLPHWRTAQRYLFTGGSVDMRDAAVYVREGNWTDAIALWKRHYMHKKGKQKMYAACNIALGYEMQDSIAAATEWAEKAQHMAYQIDRLDEKTADGLNATDVPNYVFATVYLNELQERLQGIARLDAQMQRFKEEE